MGRWKRLIGAVIFAAFAFGGTFSDWSCRSNGTTVTQNAVTAENGK